MKTKIALAALCLSGLSTSAMAVDCSGIPAWNATASYGGGSQVKEQNNAYKANWWSQGHNPVNYSGQWQEWTLLGACDGVVSSSSKSSVASSVIVSSSSRSSSLVISSSSSSSSVVVGNCASPQYVAGTSYAAGALTQNAGSEYRCTVAGWCGSTASWAYAPGTGAHWQQAWELVRSCGAVSSSVASSAVTTSKSSSSSSTIVVSSSRSSSSTGGNGRVPGDAAALPKHALVGYWHNFDNGSGVIRLADVDASWDVIVIAFVDDAGNGNVEFRLDPALNKAQFIQDVAAKRAQGKNIVLSYGGEKGTVTLNNSTNLANFVNSTAAIINEYGFDGVDIDLESGAGVLHGAPVISNMVSAIKQLHAMFPDLYVSMAPEHPYVQGGYVAYSGIWGAYLPMIDQLRNELDLLHVQLYNNGGLATPYSPQAYQAGTVDMMVASARMMIEGFPLANGTAGFFNGLRPDQVALGLPSGPRAAGSGQATTADINRAVSCLALRTNCASNVPLAAYSDFRGVMTWSINWDVKDGRIFSVPVGNHLKTLP
ncbi:chitinase [Cellvibrio mixtus]|uniref:chitinase n=1 Tax=Cellvibrio mixtus TaxID=39650 RepID=UPI000586B64A|nr:glycosyl hydrolase family 18 protein [Cellvibrio mixtus]